MSEEDARAQIDALQAEAELVREKDAPILQELFQGPDAVSNIKAAKLNALAQARRNLVHEIWAEHEQMVNNDWFATGTNESPSEFLDSLTGEA